MILPERTVAALEELTRQISINDFADSLGHKAKMLKAYWDAMNILSEHAVVANQDAGRALPVVAWVSKLPSAEVWPQISHVFRWETKVALADHVEALALLARKDARIADLERAQAQALDELRRATLALAQARDTLAKLHELLDGSNAVAAHPMHGKDCQKVQHVGYDGYLHLAEDDGPYDVDGVTYCGRCHGWLADGGAL